MRYMTRLKCIHTYDDIISIDNLLMAWKEFKSGKKSREDVQQFERNLMRNIITLHNELSTRIYRHSLYKAFNISDPKPRNIHKAEVRDRLLHHALYRILYSFFDNKFIHDSYSCRVHKGTHKAINRFRDFSRKVSQNNTRTCWVLKCDVRKFFANIDHQILKEILKSYIQDHDILWLLSRVIDSFSARQDLAEVGLPLGNLTSQLLVNIYMNEFDHFMKRELKVRYYIRYADDFVILHEDKKYLEGLLLNISIFLQQKLKLELHPDKVYIKTLASGVDFLGWVHFPTHRTLRTSTKRKMLKAMKDNPSPHTIASYEGMLKWGNGHTLAVHVGHGFHLERENDT